MTEVWQKARSYLAAGVALVACPCHLVVTLPLLLSLTAGTAMGLFLERNQGAIFAVSTVLFLGGLMLTFRWLGEKGESCPAPAKQTEVAWQQRDRPTQARTAQRAEEGITGKA